ncbi:hypothetical protein ACFLWA_04390 [Chloroflexota bacterium]
MNKFKRGIWTMLSPHRVSDLSPGRVRGMAKGIMTTRPDEIGCLQLFEQMDHFAEMQLSGMDAAQAMPLVQDHLNRCRDCQEEYLALLATMEMKPVD